MRLPPVPSLWSSPPTPSDLISPSPRLLPARHPLRIRQEYASVPASTHEWRKGGESDQIQGEKQMKLEIASGQELSDKVAWRFPSLPYVPLDEERSNGCASGRRCAPIRRQIASISQKWNLAGLTFYIIYVAELTSWGPIALPYPKFDGKWFRSPQIVTGRRCLHCPSIFFLWVENVDVVNCEPSYLTLYTSRQHQPIWAGIWAAHLHFSGFLLSGKQCILIIRE